MHKGQKSVMSRIPLMSVFFLMLFTLGTSSLGSSVEDAQKLYTWNKDNQLQDQDLDQGNTEFLDTDDMPEIEEGNYEEHESGSEIGEKRAIKRNHKTYQQLRSISLETVGFGHLSCLKAFTERGLLFLMMASKSGEGIDCREDPNTGACILFALNPKTSEMICLECFCLEERLNTVGTNGQYIAAGQQGTGKVNIWNITNSQSYATLQVFQDEVNSIGFHLDRPVIAFGSTGGCVHLFSLC